MEIFIWKFYRRWGGVGAHTRKKKTYSHAAPDHLNTSRSKTIYFCQDHLS